LLTGDHKRIAMLYLVSITFFFFIGGVFASLIRLELLTPAGDLVSSDTYNKMFTMHGLIMVFLFLVPSIPATLGNFLLPIMVGAKDLAFPKINLLSWYLYVAGGLFMLVALISGGADMGWTFTTPLSTHYSNTHVITVGLGVFIAGFSSIFTGLNFIVTTHRMRAPGMTWFRLPLFVWAQYATSILMILNTPVLAITLVLVILERAFGVGVFDPTKGGDPILFQHLFWFYSHPAVYIMILPGMGVISETISTFSRKRVFGYTAVAFSSVAIALFSMLVWAHHMFIMGISNYAALVFSLMTMLVAVPSAIKVFNWSATLYKGSVTFETPMPHRSVSRHDGYGHPPDRDLLHRRALPLRHGGRHVDGLLRRYPLLVAQDDRPHVSGRALENVRRDYVRRLHPDILPPIHPGLPRDAAPLPRVPAGVSNPQRALHCRRFSARRRIYPAADVPDVVAEVRADCRIESLAGHGTRVADSVTAHDCKL
jgi:cytochrome c oxidase subunit 1